MTAASLVERHADAATHQRRLADHVERVVRAASGGARGLRPALRAALLTCPRHLFVDRYQLDTRGPVLDVAGNF